MKKTLRFLAFALVLVMIGIAMCACTGPSDNNGGGDTNPDNGGDNNQQGNKYADIAGEYYLDAAELGMPMSWYVKVTADGKFTISNQRDYETAANLKGKGTIGDKDGTYMFLYEDSTPDKPKSATFTVVNGNLVFSTAVPIGGATISPKVEGDVTTNPIAMIIGAEEHLGTYMGEYVKEIPGMPGGGVTYTYALKLDYGYTYTFESSYSMMGVSETRTETGHFKVDGTKITFTSNAEGATAVDGTIAEKKITAAFKLSDKAAAPQEVTAEFAPYADVAGQYSACASIPMGPMSMKFYTFLTLNGNGQYEYVAYADGEAEATYSENGTFTMDGNNITLTSDAEGAAPVSGVIENYTISGNALAFKVADFVPKTYAQIFYAEHAQGVFSAKATTEGENPVEYTATLTLIGNSFTISVIAAEAEAPVYEISGTFEITKSMAATTMVLTVVPADANFANLKPAISEESINVELPFDPDDSTKLGFQMEQLETAFDKFVPVAEDEEAGGMGGGMTGGMGGGMGA